MLVIKQENLLREVTNTEQKSTHSLLLIFNSIVRTFIEGNLCQLIQG